jgi:phosphatidylserine/phosphatidylglycerophosphate/cardiolipin synthase-like enzyme
VRFEEFRSLVARASIIANALPHLRKLLTCTDSYRVAATIPQSLIALDPFYGSFENTALGMRRLVEEAKSDLYIVAPFFTREGIDALSTALEAAFQRGVSVTVLARCLSEGEQNRRALEGLITLSGKIPGSLSLFESESQDGSPLLHAKILARDAGEEVYVGSANLTGAGMERTLEVGVFLRGDGAREIVKLLKQLIEHSERRWP